MEKIPSADEYQSPLRVPPEHRVNTTTRARLQAFFEPFNKLLFEFVGDDFGY